ncbi:conserved exported hypothetical protein [Burkholderiales bacterium]|nr:conserved exported hypothetical protein [Burkholderiales bacterium]
MVLRLRKWGGAAVLRSVIAVVLLASSLLVRAAEPMGIATIVEGKAIVIRALSKLHAAEGVRLLADDLIQTDNGTFLRIEYDDETSIELGPETLLQLNHPSRRRAEGPSLYLLAGWLKLASGKPDARSKPSLRSTRVDVVDLAGVAVVRADAATNAVFVEQGTARWIDRRARGAQAVVMKAGDFLIVSRDKVPSLKSRPAEDFVNSVPRTFRDTLPVRYAKFQGRAVVAKNEGGFLYADVEPWVDAEPSIRRQFVLLWREKADDAAFRAPLERRLSMHPEWGPVLYPELYEPKAEQQGTSSGRGPVAGKPEAQSPATPTAPAMH